MATTLKYRGKSDVKPKYSIVDAYESDRELACGTFFARSYGSNRVYLYPVDPSTRGRYKGLKDVSLYDIKGWQNICT